MRMTSIRGRMINPALTLATAAMANAPVAATRSRVCGIRDIEGVGAGEQDDAADANDGTEHRQVQGRSHRLAARPPTTGGVKQELAEEPAHEHQLRCHNGEGEQASWFISVRWLTHPLPKLHPRLHHRGGATSYRVRAPRFRRHRTAAISRVTDTQPLAAKPRGPVWGPSVSVPSWSRVWRLGGPDGCWQRAVRIVRPATSRGRALTHTLGTLLKAAGEAVETVRRGIAVLHALVERLPALLLAVPAQGVGAAVDLVAIETPSPSVSGFARSVPSRRSVAAPSPSPSASRSRPGSGPLFWSGLLLFWLLVLLRRLVRCWRLRCGVRSYRRSCGRSPAVASSPGLAASSARSAPAPARPRRVCRRDRAWPKLRTSPSNRSESIDLPSMTIRRRARASGLGPFHSYEIRV